MEDAESMQDQMASLGMSQMQNPNNKAGGYSPFRPPNDEEVFITRETEK